MVTPFLKIGKKLKIIGLITDKDIPPILKRWKRREERRQARQKERFQNVVSNESIT